MKFHLEFLFFGRIGWSFGVCVYFLVEWVTKMVCVDCNWRNEVIMTWNILELHILNCSFLGIDIDYLFLCDGWSICWWWWHSQIFKYLVQCEWWIVEVRQFPCCMFIISNLDKAQTLNYLPKVYSRSLTNWIFHFKLKCHIHSSARASQNKN